MAQLVALLMDFGGVVQRSALELLPSWATRVGLPGYAGRRSGPFGSLPDELWHRMQRREVQERDYWAVRAKELGELWGERWTVRDLFVRLTQPLDEGALVRPDAVSLVRAARIEGVPVGVLSNDLEHFHGRQWVAEQKVLELFDVVVDGSVTGVLKPDRRAYELAAARLGVPTSRLVFLDDQQWNVDGARRLGATAIHVNIADPAPAFRTAGAALALPGYS